MLTNAILLGASLSGLASAAVFTVSVGAGGALAFQPSTTTAQIGDTVEFHFSNVLHSVAQSSANAPCTYNSTGFFSTEQRNTNSVFTVSITDKEPKYFFCSVGSHCSSGMVGIINPGAVTQSDFANNAKRANTQGPSGNAAVGGTLSTGGAAAVSSSAASSGASGASSAAGASGTASSTAATASPTKTGAASRMAIAAPAAVMVLAGAFAAYL